MGIYIKDSLNDMMRQKRGKGIQRHVSSTTLLPQSWKGFLCASESRTKFLAQQVARLSPNDGKVIYATEGTNVLSTMTDADVTSFVPCLHEEADTCLFLHAGDAALKGHRKLCICTVHTDVILAIIMFNQINLNELWLAKVHFHYIATYL